MKDLYKNPTLYYVLVPVVMGIWPLLVWGLYLPQAKDTLDDEVRYTQEAQVVALDILRLDPERLEFVDSNDAGKEFSYANVIDKVAGLCNIPASKYELNAGIIIKKEGKRSQSAHVKLKHVGVVQFGKFLSLMLRWENLQCNIVKLTKVKGAGLRDAWNVAIDFRYSY